MSCFSPTRGALSSSSSLCPFAFKVSALRCRSLPWPCDFIPSAPRLSECSKWYTACLDGMRRYLPGGLVLGSLLSATFPPKSLCSLFPNSPAGWLCRSHLSLCSCWRGLAPSLYPWCPASTFRRPSSPTSTGCPWRRCSFPLLPPAFGGKDDHQPREGGQRAELRLHPTSPPILWGGKRAVLWLHLFGFDGFGAASNAAPRRQMGRGCPSTARATVALCAGLPHPWLPLHHRPHCSDAARGVIQDVVRRGGGSSVLGWSCPHPRRRTGARTFPHALRRPPSPASHRCRGGRCRRC
jgi:hypothetical protein